ncbi:spx domain-containing protein 3 [Phtheirospermum japonicum]|uniref:Spx domain-containing protein 3 n=1 Tax=Phtheirospermum japonicum TaxID=374723 RepID=A0A830CF58_9LAMI|nr:spx domain-containing protein 3 [Phtheirospermum japonicum]
MKFGKRLKHQIEQSLPEWRDKFLSYKELKKLVKSISTTPTMSYGSSDYVKAEFICLLNIEIEKFNSFVMEQEEDFIIRHKELQERIEDVIQKWGANGTQPSELEYKEEMAKIRKHIVNFHGLAKILKKYDKRTGGVLRLPFIQKVMQQPFFTTDLISKLVKECETTIDTVLPPSEAAVLFHAERTAAVRPAGEGIFRNTVAALRTMQEMRRGSSTYGQFSLPPLNLPDFEVIESLQVVSPIHIT